MAAPYNPPKKNEDFVTDIFLEDMSAAGTFRVNPTIAAGDFKVKKDDGSYANLTTLPDVNPDGSSTVKVVFSADEMNGDRITLLGVDQTNPKEWADYGLCILTTA